MEFWSQENKKKNYNKEYSLCRSQDGKLDQLLKLLKSRGFEEYFIKQDQMN